MMETLAFNTENMNGNQGSARIEMTESRLKLSLEWLFGKGVFRIFSKI